MRKRSLLILPLLFACQLSGAFSDPAPTPDPTAVATSIPENLATAIPEPTVAAIASGPLAGQAIPLPAVRFEPWGNAEPIPVSIPPVIPIYAPDLGQVIGLDPFNLTEEELAILERDGFLERPDLARSAADVYTGDGPHMLTVDMVLLLTQAVQREVLNKSWRAFSDRQTYDLVTGLITESKQQLTAADDPLTEQAARKNLAIFNMAGKFYDEDWPVEPDVAAEIELELSLFQSEGDFESPLLGKRVRYDAIRRDPVPAVRVYSWFLISGIRIDPQQAPAEQRLAGKQIELLLDIWSADRVPAWKAAYTDHRYRNGTLGPYVEQWAALNATGTRGDDFVRSATQFQDAEFRLFNEQRPMHQMIFEQLVFNSVGVHASPDSAPPTAKLESAGTIRAVPRTLDVAAVFGSQIALIQLVADGESGYAGWDQQMAQLQGQVSQAGYPATWQQDFLHAIRPLAEPIPQSYPAYMRSPSWNRLAQWETGFLLSTMPYVGGTVAQGNGQADRQIYVEPRPELYANLAVQTRTLADGLVARQMLDAADAERLLTLESDLLMLKSIAEKQLAGVGPQLNSPESAVLAAVLSQASQIQPNEAWQVYSGPSGKLTGRFTGMVPTVFIVLDANQQVAVQGVRVAVTSDQ